MGLFGSNEILGIAGETLAFILNASRESHPNEYMGYLQATDAGALGLERSGRVITNVHVIPGTETDHSSATVKTTMQPNTTGSVGSVHSHPSGVLRPSDADLDTFGRGDVHIIVGAPYEWSDWQAFDSQGEKRELDVLDVEPPDEEFFDITQEEIDRELQEEREPSETKRWSWVRSLFR